MMTSLYYIRTEEPTHYRQWIAALKTAGNKLREFESAGEHSEDMVADSGTPVSAGNDNPFRE